jgi:hypothetical protein
MATETPAALTFADEGDAAQTDVSTSGDDSFCIEMHPDNSAAIPSDAPASEHDSEIIESAQSYLGVVRHLKWDNGRTLTVCFFNGSATLRQNVQNYANQWTQFANIKFRFVAGRSADIRISFTGHGGASQSYVGTENTLVDGSTPTMLLGFGDRTPDVTVRRTTLHEFGHALGCVHEHSQPNVNIEWNRQAVFAAHRGTWDQKTVEANILDRYNHEFVQATLFDKFSIMLYPIPASWTNGKFSSGWNNNLSETDKAFISALYPVPPS